MSDPVDCLIRTAKGEVVDDPFRVTGVMIQYYHACKRELWFDSRHIEIDRDNPAIIRGTQVDESAYDEKRRNLHLGMIAIDVLDDGRVIEVKPSSTLEEPARMQLCYYLWYLREVVEVEKDGVLAHPRERRREKVELTEERVERIESSIRGIHDVVSKGVPPVAKRKPYCDSCAFHDLCWC